MDNAGNGRRGLRAASTAEVLAALDETEAARGHAAGMSADVARALRVAREIEHWQQALA